MKETVEAKYQLKDENGVMTDDEGKVLTSGVACEYDFGDDLEDAVAKFGPDVVYSNFRAAAKVTLQNIMRTKNRAGQTQEQIQAIVDNWKPGMVIERTAVDPSTAVLNSFGDWPEEKRRAFLEQLKGME